MRRRLRPLAFAAFTPCPPQKALQGLPSVAGEGESRMTHLAKLPPRWLVGRRERGADWRHERHAFWRETRLESPIGGVVSGKTGACRRPPSLSGTWWVDGRFPLRGSSQWAAHSHSEDGTSPPAPSPFSPCHMGWGETMGKAGRGRGGAEDERCSCPQCSTDEGAKRNICFDFEGSFVGWRQRRRPHPNPSPA